MVWGLDQKGVFAEPAAGDRALVGEILEARASAVAAHAAPAQATHWQEVIGSGLHYIVEADRSGGQGGCDHFTSLAVFGKDVEGKRGGLLPDPVQRLVEGIVWDDGKKRAEDFFLHRRAVP